jgi:hypothetical protein
MIFCPLHGHRMAGSAHLGILWPQNTCFRGKIGHRMKNTASAIILWQENESGELFFGRAGECWKGKKTQNHIYCFCFQKSRRQRQKIYLNL